MTTGSPTGEVGAIVERLFEEARQEEAAHKMLADAKTARQTDREDAWTDAGYSWVSAEQTTRWKAATLLQSLEARIDAKQTEIDDLVHDLRRVMDRENAFLNELERLKARPATLLQSLEARIEELEGALAKCEHKFRHYEDLHRLKCTAEGDEKADRNREMADMCAAALTPSNRDRT